MRKSSKSQKLKKKHFDYKRESIVNLSDGVSPDINLIKKEIQSPEVNFEYSFSPNLIIKKGNNTGNNLNSNSNSYFCSPLDKFFSKCETSNKDNEEYSIDCSNYLQDNNNRTDVLKSQTASAIDERRNFKSKNGIYGDSYGSENKPPIFKIQKDLFKRLLTHKEEISDKFYDTEFLEILKNEKISHSDKSSKLTRRTGMKYKMFTGEEKKFCIKLFLEEKMNLKDISDTCEIPLKSLKRWVSVGHERKKGCGRKVKDPSLEPKLLQWYYYKVSRGDCPTPKEVTKKALKYSTQPDFLASKGWLEKFKLKHNLTFRNRSKTSHN